MLLLILILPRCPLECYTLWHLTTIQVPKSKLFPENAVWSSPSKNNLSQESWAENDPVPATRGDGAVRCSYSVGPDLKSEQHAHADYCRKPVAFQLRVCSENRADKKWHSPGAAHFVFY